MKKVIKKKVMVTMVILAMMMPYVVVKAQGYTLKFNRVLLVTSTNTTPVQSNTVWKVENILPSASLINAATQNNSVKTDCIITVNSTPVVVSTGITGLYNGTSNGSPTCSGSNCGSAYQVPYVTSMWAWANGYASGGGQILHGPIWLPAGTTLAAGSNVAYISVIEFLVQ